MLKIYQIEKRSQIQDLFKQFDSQDASWIVSDLRTKFETQQNILEQKSFFVDTSVLRASDFWKILLKRALPQFRIISRDFARSLLRDLLDSESTKLGLNASSEKTVLTYIDQLHPFFFHPKGKETLKNWFEQNPQASLLWQEWAIIAEKCLEIFTSSGLVVSKWVPGLLLEVPNIEKYWQQNIWVDLGSEITKSEMDLFLNLSKNVDVHLIEPTPEWRKDHLYLLKPYDDVRGFAGKNIQKMSVSQVEHKAKFQALRFSGELAEIKFATSRVRQWLESGVPAKNIAVIAPDIETYWPVLKVFFDQEGLAANKNEVVKLGSLTHVNQWLASLRSAAKSLSSSDLELSFYGRDENELISYEQFKSLFSHIYSEEDLRRHPTIEKIYLKTLKFEKRMLRDDFIGACLLLWDAKNEIAPVMQMCREVLQNASADIELNLQEWIHYLESIAALQEIVIEPAAENGVVVTKLMSAHSSQLTHRIFMGLCDENLKRIGRGGIPNQDLVNLSSQTGFNPENSDQTSNEFELRWIVESLAQENYLTVGMTDLSGSLLTPSAYWLTQNTLLNKSHKTETADPGSCRWDQIQQSDLHDSLKLIRSHSDEVMNRIEKRISIDLGELEPEKILVQEINALSPSSVEKYLNCPFQYTAAAFFKLQSLPELDLDVDARTRGSLVHTLFQKITEVHPFRTGWSDAELDALIEKIRLEEKFVFADEKIWLPLKNRYLKLAKRFIEIERQWRLQFPKTQTIKTEAAWNVQFEGIALRGRIDRVDTDNDGRFVVIDYKSSASQLENYQNWLKEKSLQLLFYMWAIEKNGVADLKGEVIGAFYYVFKNLKREIGFQLDETSGILYPKRNKGPSASPADKEKILNEFENALNAAMKNMKEGVFAPLPSSQDICKRCDWKSICRASHLN